MFNQVFFFKEKTGTMRSPSYVYVSICAPPLLNSEQVEGRSQWPRGLRHELSSPSQTLG
jgi:hypothetical protein